MFALIAAAALTPAHISMCDTVGKLVQLPDTTVVQTYAVRDQYGCEIEQGKHRYNPANDRELQHLLKDNARDLAASHSGDVPKVKPLDCINVDFTPGRTRLLCRKNIKGL